MVKITHHGGLRLWQLVILTWLFDACFASHGLGQGLQTTDNCTQPGRDSTKNAFSFLQLGNSSGLEQCLSSCCGNELCELAIRSGTNCYGVSCKRLGMCHQILDQLVRGADKPSGKSSIIDHAVTESTVEVADLQCPQRIIPTFTVLLQQSRPVHGFIKLHDKPTSSDDCKRRCCELSDCEISFTENRLCYGLVCGDGPTCQTKSFTRQGIHLQLAIIERNREVTRSLDDTDEDDEDFDLGSDASDTKHEALRQLHHSESSRNSKSPTKHKKNAAGKLRVRVKPTEDVKMNKKKARKNEDVAIKRHAKHASHKTTSKTTSTKTRTTYSKKGRNQKVHVKHSKKHSVEKTSATTKSAVPSFLFSSVKPAKSTDQTSTGSHVGKSNKKAAKKGSVERKKNSRRANRKKAVIPSFLFTYRPKQDKIDGKSKSQSVLQDRDQSSSKKSNIPLFLLLLDSSKKKSSVLSYRKGMDDQPSLKRSKVQSSQIRSKSSESAQTNPTLPSFLFRLRNPEVKTLKSDRNQAKSRSVQTSDTKELVTKKSKVSSVKKSLPKKVMGETQATDGSDAPAFLFLSKKSEKIKPTKTKTSTISKNSGHSGAHTKKTNIHDQEPPPFLLSVNDTKTLTSNDIIRTKQKKEPEVHYTKKQFIPLEISETDDSGSGDVKDDESGNDSGSAEYDELLMPTTETSGQDFSAMGSDLMFRAQKHHEASTQHKHQDQYSDDGPSGDDLGVMLDFNGSGAEDIYERNALTSGSGMGGESGSTGDILIMDPHVNEEERSGVGNPAKKDQPNHKPHVPEEIRNKDILELRSGKVKSSNRHLTLVNAKGSEASTAHKNGPNGKSKKMTGSKQAATRRSSNIQKAASRLGNSDKTAQKATGDKHRDGRLHGKKGIKSISDDTTKKQDQKKKAKKQKEAVSDLMRRAHSRKVHDTMTPKRVKQVHQKSNHGHILKKLEGKTGRKSRIVRPPILSRNKTSFVSVKVKTRHSVGAISGLQRNKVRGNGNSRGSMVDIHINTTKTTLHKGDQKKTIFNSTGLSTAGTRRRSNGLMSHFLNDSDSRNGLAFSVKSSKKHKAIHRKKEIQIDADDLGDADFDIMMSNDIPHEAIPKAEKKKTKHKEEHKHKHKTTEKKTKVKAHKTKGGKKVKKNHKPYVILGEDANDDDDDDDNKDIIRGVVKFQGERHGQGGREGKRRSHRHPKHSKKKISSDNEDSNDDSAGTDHEQQEKKNEHVQRTEHEAPSEETEHDKDLPTRHHHHHHHHTKVHVVSEDENHDDEAETRDRQNNEGEYSHRVHHSKHKDYDSENSETGNNRYEHSYIPKVRHHHRHIHLVQHQPRKTDDEYERQDGKPKEREREKEEWDREHHEEENEKHSSHGDYEHFGHHVAHEKHRANDEERQERIHKERQERIHEERQERIHEDHQEGRNREDQQEESVRHHKVFRYEQEHDDSEKHEYEKETNRHKHHHHRFHDKENYYWSHHKKEREHELHEPQEQREPHVLHEQHEKPVRNRVFLGEDTERASWKHHEYHKHEDDREHAWKEPERHRYSDEEHDHNEKDEEYHGNDYQDKIVDSQHNQYYSSEHEFNKPGKDEETQRYNEARMHHVDSEHSEGKNQNQEKWEDRNPYNGESHEYRDEHRHSSPQERPYETHHDLSVQKWPHEESREQFMQAHVVNHEAESRDHHVPYETSEENRFEKFSSTQTNPDFEPRHDPEAYPHFEGENGRELANHLHRDGWRQTEQSADTFGISENKENGPQYQHYEHLVDANSEKYEGDNVLRNKFEGPQNPMERPEKTPSYPWETFHRFNGDDRGPIVGHDGRPPEYSPGPFDNTKGEKQLWQSGPEHQKTLNPQWRYNQEDNYNSYYHSGNPESTHQSPRPPWADWSGNPWQNQAWENRHLETAPPMNWQSRPTQTSGNSPWSRFSANHWPHVGQNGAPPSPQRTWPNNNNQFHNSNVGNNSQVVNTWKPTAKYVVPSLPSQGPRNPILSQPGKVGIGNQTSINQKSNAVPLAPRPNGQPQRDQATTIGPKSSRQGSNSSTTIQQAPSLTPAPVQNQGTLPKVSNNVNSKTTFQPTLKQKPPSTIPTHTTKRLTTTVPTTKSRTAANTVQSQSNVRKTDVPVTKGTGQKTADDKGRQNGEDDANSVNRLNGFFNDENRKQPPPQNGTNDTGKPEQHPQDQSPTKSSSPIRPNAHAPLKATSHVTPPQRTHAPIKSTHSAMKAEHPQVKPTNTPTRTFGEERQPDDITEEKGSKHRKHRAPVCRAEKVHEDTTLARGRRAGNFTKIGDVGDFDLCIKRCCQHKMCDVAYKSAETCFLVHCFSEESCETADSMTDFFNPKLCFVKRHSREEEDDDFPDQDRDQDQNQNDDDKLSPSGIREVCEMEKALGILWRKTAAGRTSSNPCPRKATGNVKRRCEADSRWLPPDFSDCVSSDYRKLYDKSKKLADGADPSPLIRELSQLTTQNIDNSLILGGDLMKSQEIMAAIVQNNGQTDLLDMTRDDLENFAKAGSNLLDLTNQQGWYSIQKSRPGSADVLRAIEMFALQAAMRLPRRDMSEPIIFNNIIIKIDRKSTGDGILSFPDYADPRIKRWDVRHDVISLPPSAFKRGEVSAASISFKSLPYLLPDLNSSSGLGPNSKVISTIVHPQPSQVIFPPVTIVLSHIKPKRGNPKCVFWDYTIRPHRGGGWSSRGCWLAHNNETHSVCQCNHLSNFAVLMDMSSDAVSEKEQKRERTMALMWIGIPVLIVGIIGALYMSFTWNRKPGVPSTVTRHTLNEKTGLLGQRVVTSQIKEEFPPSPTRDLYRALSPAYSPTAHDLEWQDEFQLAVGCKTDDSGFKKILMPQLKMLQKQLTQEFKEIDKADAKRIFLENKDAGKDFPVTEFNTELDTQLDSPGSSCSGSIVSIESQSSDETEPDLVRIWAPCNLPHNRPRTIPLKRPKLRVTFAEDTLPSPNRTDLERERFERLQRVERRVFLQNLRRWQQTSDLNTLPE